MIDRATGARVGGRWLSGRRLALALVLGACAHQGRDTPEAPTIASAVEAVEAATQGSSPITLRGEDGTTLYLRRLDLRGQIDGFLALTELEMVFENPEGRALAGGRLALRLPPGARVVRLARRESEGWREAEVVPRQDAYDDLVRQESEPALVGDGERGDRFVARISRIPHGELKILVSYVEELRGREHPYRVALAGLPRLDAFDVRVTAAEIQRQGAGDVKRLADGRARYAYRGENRRPGADVVLQTGNAERMAMRHDNMIVARIDPIPHDHAEPIQSLTVLLDTSASQAVGFDGQVDRLGELVDAIAKWTAEDIPIRVLVFDQEVETIFEGRISGFGRRHLAAIRRRGALGASDLVGALRSVSSNPSRAYQRVILLSDGVVTAGAGHLDALEAEVGRLAAVGVRRLDAVALGTGARTSLLTALSRGGLPRDGLVLRGDLTPDAMLHKLVQEVVSVELSVPGAAWSFPRRLEGIQADDTVLVYADVADVAGDQPLEVVVGGFEEKTERIGLSTVHATSPALLENAWAAAYVRHMHTQVSECDATGLDVCAGWWTRIRDWSTRHRILNAWTSLVMLGADDDYRRHGIDRWRLADLLTIGRGVVEAQGRVGALAEGARAGTTFAVLPEAQLPEIARAEGRRVRAADGTLPGSDAPTPTPASDPLASPRASLGSVTTTPRWQAATSPSAPPPSPVEEPARPRRRPEGAYDGKLLAVMYGLLTDDLPAALRQAELWRDDEPESILALVALGEVLEASGRRDDAARAYGSIIDLYPMRPEMRRLAAARLERVGGHMQWLVLDAYGKALRQRPTEPSSHRLLAYAMVRSGYYREAFESLISGFAWARSDPALHSVASVLAEDAGLVAAAWIAARPADRAYVLSALEVQGLRLATEPSLRFVLTWDTEPSDVDLAIRDGDGRLAFYGAPALTSGGRLLADRNNTGLGIEAFIIDGPASAYPYQAQVEYFTLDPRGYGMGKVEVIEHDGQGHLRFAQRPFVVSRDGATLDLGEVAGALAER